MEDFKFSAERSKGRKIIPFSSLQGAAKILHDKQVVATKAAAGYNSAKLLSDKKLYLGFQEDVEKSLVASKKALSSDDGEDDEKTDDLKDKVETDEDDLEEIENKIEDLDSKMKKGIVKWEAVEDARIRVNEVFHEAYDEVDDSEDHPERHIGDEPDSDDETAHDQWEDDLENFKKYTYKIKQKIKAGYRTHDEQIEVAHEAVEKLKEGLKLN